MSDRPGSLGDLRAVAEALADVLAERGLAVAAPSLPDRVLDASQVALLLGRDRQWVYHHAAELGAFRYGRGPKARLGFDLPNVERWKRERQLRRAPSQRAGRPKPPGQSPLRRGANLIPYDALE